MVRHYRHPRRIRHGGAPRGGRDHEQYRAALKRIVAPSLTLTGTASFEGDTNKAKYNYLLSRRRGQAARSILIAEARNPDASKRIPSFTLNVEPPDIGAAQPPASWSTD